MFETPLKQQSQPKGLVCSMTTALTPADIKELDHIRPPNDLSNTPPSRLATAENHQESPPVRGEYSLLRRPKRRPVRAKTSRHTAVSYAKNGGTD